MSNELQARMDAAENTLRQMGWPFVAVALGMYCAELCYTPDKNLAQDIVDEAEELVVRLAQVNRGR